MIIPTPEYDPMFADDGTPFCDKMMDYIRREFSDLLPANAAKIETQQDLVELSLQLQNRFWDQPERTNSAA